MENLMQPKFNIIEYIKCLPTGHVRAMNDSPLMTWCEKCGRLIIEEKIVA